MMIIAKNEIWMELAAAGVGAIVVSGVGTTVVVVVGKFVVVSSGIPK